MAIAKSIVEEGHGGRIWFESAGKGAGATFHVIIPEKSPEP
jgi:signal transduction histidine kinase